MEYEINVRITKSDSLYDSLKSNFPDKRVKSEIVKKIVKSKLSSARESISQKQKSILKINTCSRKGILEKNRSKNKKKKSNI